MNFYFFNFEPILLTQYNINISSFKNYNACRCVMKHCITNNLFHKGIFYIYLLYMPCEINYVYEIFSSKNLCLEFIDIILSSKMFRV